MNAGRDVERLIADWLQAEAPPHAPDRILDLAARTIDRTQQRRFAAWRPRTMFDRLAVAAVAAVLAIGAFTLGASLITTPDNAAGRCPATFREADAVDTSAAGLTQDQRAWGIARGVPDRVGNGRIAAFTWDAAGAPQSVITIDPATGSRCRLLSFAEEKHIRANVTGLDWSPTGEALAIGVENPPSADGSPDGSTSGQLLIWTPNRLILVWSGPGQNPHFEWAPDGRGIAVWTPYGDPTPNTRIVFADGSPDRIIDVQRPLGLKWSPDGSRWIVAEANQDFGAVTLLSVVDLSDGRVTPIDLGIHSLSPEGWLDDERLLLFGVRQDGSIVGYLDVPLAAPANFSVVPLPEAALRPDKFVVLSPDGGRVAYETAGRELEIADLAGGPDETPVHVDVGGAGILGLAWAPDGSKLVFTTYPSIPGSTATNTTRVVNPDGTELREIAGGNVWTQDDPWQPVPAR